MQVMGKNKVLVKVHPEGKYVVDLDKSIDIAQVRCPAERRDPPCKPAAAQNVREALNRGAALGQVTMGARVALRNDSYTLHLLLPTKVDPLVSLMKVEKVPDSTYDMIGGLDQQIKEIKEARPHLRAHREPQAVCTAAPLEVPESV